MRNGLIITLALAVGYVLGTLRAPAQADDSSKIVDALREMARSEATQAEALKVIARSAEKCAK